MTSIMIPSFERRFLETVREEMTHQPAAESVQLCLDLVRGLRANNAKLKPTLANLLSVGVESSLLVDQYKPTLQTSDTHLATIRKLIEHVPPLEDPAYRELHVELKLLEEQMVEFNTFLTEVLAQASEKHPIDWNRVRNAEQAYAQGKTKPFSRQPT